MAAETSDCNKRLTTKDVFIAYVHARLRDESCRVPALDCMSKQVPQRVQPIIDRIRQYDDWIMADQSNARQMRQSAQLLVSRESTDSTISSGLTKVLNNLFMDGQMSFGRLVAVVMLVNQMSQAAMLHGQCHRITKIIQWAVCYFMSHGYDGWIAARGGWEVGIQNLRMMPAREVQQVVSEEERRWSAASATPEERWRSGASVAAAERRLSAQERRQSAEERRQSAEERRRSSAGSRGSGGRVLERRSPHRHHQHHRHQHQLDPVIDAAVVGTVFLGSVVASVLNVLNRL